MDLVIPVMMLAAGSVAAGIWDLVRNDATDVLRRIVWLHSGMMAGALAQLAFPAGFLVCAIGGFAMAFGKIDRVVADRLRFVDEELANAPDDVSSLLLLHDRMDDLVGGPLGVRQATKGAALLLVFLFSLGLVGMGLYGEWLALFLGSLVSFLPIAHGTRVLVDFEESRVVQRRLADCEEELPGLLDAVEGV